MPNIMANFADADLQALARKAADYITFTCQGESEGFEIDHNGYIAFVNYEAEYRDVIGGSYEGREFEHIAELVRETAKLLLSGIIRVKSTQKSPNHYI